MLRFVRFILRWRTSVLILVALSLALALFSARRLRFQFQFSDFYDYPNNPDLPALKRANQEFGDPAGNVVVLLRAKNVFEPAVLAYLKRLTLALSAEPCFRHVDSLVDAHVIRGDGDTITSGPIGDPLPQNAEEVERLRATATASPLLVRRLVSPDASATSVLAEYRASATFATIADQALALDAARAVLAHEPPPTGVRAVITGGPVVEVETTRALLVDQLRLTPGVIAVLIVALYLAFQSWHGILLALASVSVATGWTAGIVACFGHPIDMVGSVIPTTILVYGVVDPVFVLTRFLHKLDAGLEREEAIAVASQELALPCFLTSLTTALGFAAFATSSAPTIRYYGIAVAIGVALSWVTTVVLLPVLLAVAPVPKRQFRAGYATAAIDALLARVWPFARRHVRLVYGLLALILLSGALCARSQRVVNEYVGGLPRGEERDQVRELERSLTGIVRFAVYLEGPPESMRQPAVLQAMERIELAALRIPLITYSASLASAVAEINGAFQGGGAESRSVPRSRALIAQYLALLSPEDRLRLASDDYSRSQIVILARDEGSLGAAALARSLQAALDASGLHELGVRVTLTGAGIAAYRGLDRVVSEVIYGFLIALLLVAALVAALFRSVRIALISVIPNLVPIALCFLTLRAFSINLRMDNSLVLGICIGGLFNTTIHLGARVRQLAQDPALSPDAVVEQSLRTVGPAAIFTSVILSAGFLVLTLSRFPGLQVLGLLSMVTLLSAMVADIVLSPLLFRALYGWKSAGRAARDPSVVEGGV